MNHMAPVETQPINSKKFVEYTNKIGENFFGEQTMVTKLVNKKTGSFKVISRLKERLGPIMLKMKHGNLVDDWYESTSTTVDDYKIGESQMSGSQIIADQVCVSENWITEAPNVLFFGVPR